MWSCDPRWPWNITRQCNLTCGHCYRDAAARTDPQELTTAQGLLLINDIAAAGFRVLILSGGEPLFRADCLDLVARRGRGRLRPVLGSNGTLLTPALAHVSKRPAPAPVSPWIAPTPTTTTPSGGSPSAWQGA